MVRTRNRIGERGQAVLLLVVSMSVFIFGALGLAIDGSQLFAQRQMAQAAADAAAQAGIVTIFNGGTAIGTTAYYCTSANTTSPCTYAAKNNFTAAATACTTGADSTPGHDCIKVDPNPGVTVSDLDPGSPNELQVTITRDVSMTVMKMVGLSSFRVTARATAAILDIKAPVPIIVTHPTLSGSFNLSGTGSGAKIKICGGPQRSIEVNSSSSTSMTWNGNPEVNLTKAGPMDPGNCTTGTGGDLGDFGGPSNGVTVLTNFGTLGTTEHFIQPADPILDPLGCDIGPSCVVPAPTAPANAHTSLPLPNGLYGCPTSPAKACTLYFPGTYNADIHSQNETSVFAPGIYYMTGTSSGANFGTAANGYMQLATGLTDSSSTTTVTLDSHGNVSSVTSCCGTSTSWDGTQANGGMMVYMTGPAASIHGCTPASTAANVGQISVGANGSVNLIGSPTNGTYKGVLFFIDRSAATQSHTLDGGGGLTLYGTVYTTDTLGQMKSSTCSQYQNLTMQGNPGSSTLVTGEIITSTLTLGGTPGIVMNLNPNALTVVRQIALVNGE